MDKLQAEAVNKHLAETFGTYHGQPRFRLVWSTDLLEMRTGDFAVEVKGMDLDLGTVRDTRTVPKYRYAMDRWVLEELIFSQFTPPELVAQGPLSYEPLYIFWKGDNGEYVEPILDDLNKICHFRVFTNFKEYKPSPAELQRRKIELEQKRRTQLREKIDEAIPDTAHAIVHGEGVAFGRGASQMKGE